MGGAKCSYKNCSVRSDGKTHMFHYPVLDRARCHKWLTNAYRLDFLTLTVSQLKNRMICQHHFNPDDFMNSTMAKLKQNSIPSIDGPYCDSDDLPVIKYKYENLESLVIEDLENLDYMRKYISKDVLSKKYCNFLSDIEVVEEDVTDQFPLMEPRVVLKTSETDSLSNKKKMQNSIHTAPENPSRFIKRFTRSQGPPDKVKEQFTSSSHKIQHTSRSNNVTSTNPNNPAKIKILSVENVYDSIPQIGDLKPMNFASVLPLPRRKSSNKYDTNTLKINTSTEDAVNNNSGANNHTAPRYTFSIDEKLNITVQDHNQHVSKPNDKDLIEINIPPVNSNDNNLPVVTHNLSLTEQDLNQVDTKSTVKTEAKSKVNRSLLKVNANKKSSKKMPQNPEQRKDLVFLSMKKLNPEQISAIQQKRNFNKQLGDIISYHMDLAQRQTKSSITVEDVTNNQVAEEIEPTQRKRMSEKAEEIEPAHRKRKSELHKDTEDLFLNMQDNVLATIEARMKQMQELLLNKIDNNTQTIVKLKKSVDEQKYSSGQGVSTQTNTNEEAHKKYLYKEISKYLSADANSLIYEELFINKHCSDVPKRRKFR